MLRAIHQNPDDEQSLPLLWHKTFARVHSKGLIVIAVIDKVLLDNHEVRVDLGLGSGVPVVASSMCFIVFIYL